jgi:hypothetical protein
MDDAIVWGVVGAWGAWLLYRWGIHSSRERMEARSLAGKLLDRIASSDELIAFVRTPEGRALLHVPRSAARPDARRSALRFLLFGLFAIAGSVALFLNGARIGGGTDLNEINEYRLTLAWATVFAAVGAATVLAAAITYTLGKRWELFTD